MQNPTAGQMATGVKRRLKDKGGVSSSELSTILDKLADPKRRTGLAEVRQVARPSGSTFPVSGTWDGTSAMVLTVPQDADTTDRSLVERARYPTNESFASAARPLDMGHPIPRGFDADGFADSGEPGSGGGGSGGGAGRGLQKGVFYWSPFMTCAACNTLAVIDSAAARSFSAVLNGSVHPDAAAALEPEALPKCATCGSTSDWWDGSHNLLNLLGANKKEMAERMKKERNSTMAIQRAYRSHLRRRWGRAEVQRHLIYAMLFYRSACVVQSLMRGRLGRRRSVTFVALRIVQGANLRLRTEAIKGGKEHKRRVFWYTKEQVPEVYRDYLSVAQRTGFDPPRLVVEENLWEIARRVRVKEAFYARLVQKKFRGMQARRFLVVFLREVVRVRDIRSAAAFRLQRLYRGWVGRNVVEKLLVAKFKGKLLSGHLRNRRDDREARQAEDLRVKLLTRYSKERAEERAARLTGLVHPNNSVVKPGSKMHAFQESAYGDDAVTVLMQELTGNVKAVMAREKKEAEAHSQRAEYVREFQNRGGNAMEIYYEEEMRQRSQQLIDRLSTEPPPRRAKAVLSQHNARRQGKGTSFKYPSHLYIEPSLALYEDTGVEPPNPRAAAGLRRERRLRQTAEAAATEARAKVRLEKRKSGFAEMLKAAARLTTAEVNVVSEFRGGSFDGAEGGGGGGGGGGEEGGVGVGGPAASGAVLGVPRPRSRGSFSQGGGGGGSSGGGDGGVSGDGVGGRGNDGGQGNPRRREPTSARSSMAAARASIAETDGDTGAGGLGD